MGWLERYRTPIILRLVVIIGIGGVVIYSKQPARSYPLEITPPASTSNLSEDGSSSAQSHKININTASASELESLWGIGPVKAQAIIDYRNEHGDFQSIEELMNVPGIKSGIYEANKDLITVGETE